MERCAKRHLKSQYTFGDLSQQMFMQANSSTTIRLLFFEIQIYAPADVSRE